MSTQTWVRSGARLLSWARTLLSRRDAAGDAAEELRFHIDAHAQELAAQGMTAAEAHRRAAAAAGQPDNLHERKRDALGLRLWDETWADVCYGLRGLWRNPGFAAIAICSLALAIGSATAMFSLVYATVLDVYPYADANRTVNPVVQDPKHPEDQDWFHLNRAQYELYSHAAPFADAFGEVLLNMQLSGRSTQQVVSACFLTANAAEFLRVRALLGRGLRASDGGYGVPPPGIVVLGYKF